MHKLILGHGHRKGEAFNDGSTKADRKYIDFIVSGQSLGQILELPEFDLIGTFGWAENKEYEDKQIDEFLGQQKPELESGRTSFYVCSECGDIGCGAVTAKIELTEKTVVWKEFGYENDYSKPDLSGYTKIGPFVFDKIEYIKTFELLKKEIE